MTKRTAKTLVLLATFVLLARFILGVIQSIKLNSLMFEKAEIEKNYQQLVDEHQFFDNEDFRKAYKRQTGNYGNQDDRIYQ